MHPRTADGIGTSATPALGAPELQYHRVGGPFQQLAPGYQELYARADGRLGDPMESLSAETGPIRLGARHESALKFVCGAARATFDIGQKTSAENGRVRQQAGVYQPYRARPGRS